LYLCTYLCPFHEGTARLISTKFCTDLPTNSGKVFNTSMTPQTRALDPGQTPKPKWVMVEKTLCNVKCPDGYPFAVQLISRAAPGPGWPVTNNISLEATPYVVYHIITQ